MHHFKSFIALVALFLASMLIIGGCKPQQTVIKEETVTRYVDSTIWHTDTTYFQVPVEVYADYTSLLDTLSLETNCAIAWSAVDTINMLLVGEIRNKDIKIPVKYLWKEKVITKDSIVEKPVPYPVIEKERYIPNWMKFMTAIAIVIILLFVGSLLIHKL